MERRTHLENQIPMMESELQRWFQAGYVLMKKCGRRRELYVENIWEDAPSMSAIHLYPQDE
jgi:hypothetical protein